MTPDGIANRSGISPLLVGAVIGVVAGFLVDLFWLRGLAVLVAIAVVSAFVRPRFVMLAAALIGAGGLWLPFTTVTSCYAWRTRPRALDPAPCRSRSSPRPSSSWALSPSHGLADASSGRVTLRDAER
jgi:hypothetical protein